MTAQKTHEGWPLAESPFHGGERAVHARFGFERKAEQAGRRMIRSAMPDQHRALFAQLPFLIVGSVATDGSPWASIVRGLPGFLSSPDAHTLDVAALPVQGDSFAPSVGQALGLLGIQLETRRRNRMNGRIGRVSDLGFSVSVEQSFGNCPQYITPRSPLFRGDPRTKGPVLSQGPLLSEAALNLVARSDTCFIASATGQQSMLSAGAGRGVDVSHRGGPVGFAAAHSAGGRTVLQLPDYSGNNMFNTLGNLTVYPRAGLLFVDFGEGLALSLTGDTEIVWEGPDVTAIADAQRLIRFHVRSGSLFPAV